MKNRIKNILWMALLAVMFFSCASAPDLPEETQEIKDTVKETTEFTAEDLKAAKAEVITSKEAAIQAKAPKAAAELFNRGGELEISAESAEADGNIDQAVKLYKDAVLEYQASREEAEKIKAEALAAMEAADKAIAQVQTNANAALEEAREDGEE